MKAIFLIVFLVFFYCCHSASAATLNINNQIQVKKSGLSYNRIAKTYDTSLTVTNTSTEVIYGPITVAINISNPVNIKLANAMGLADNGLPVIVLPLTQGSLAPGASLNNIYLSFNNPNNQKFTYTLSFSAPSAAINPNSQPIATTAFPDKGDNFSFITTSALGHAPSPIKPDSSLDIMLPAQVGDIVRYEFSGTVATPAATGLTLSAWSIGGSQSRDWSSGITSLQSVSGFANIPAGNFYVSPRISINPTVSNTVQASDIDANGMITLRLYGTNSTAAGIQTHLFIDYPGNGTICQVRAINLKNNQSAATALRTVIAYPNKTKGTDLKFTTTTNPFTQSVAVNPSGAFDIIIPATELDVISYHLQGAIQGNLGLRFSVWSIGGSALRSWTDDASSYNPDSGLYQISGGNTQTLNATIANRVIESDLDAKGNITLRLNVLNTNGGGIAHYTFLGVVMRVSPLTPLQATLKVASITF